MKNGTLGKCWTRNRTLIFIFKFEEVMRSNGQIPGPGIDPKVVNVNNSIAKRHKLLKIDTPSIFMTRNSMVISIFKFGHVMSPYGRPPGSGVDPKVANVNNSVAKRHKFTFNPVYQTSILVSYLPRVRNSCPSTSPPPSSLTPP